MSVIERSALVMHSAKQMFDLINDCESYPKFLPGCTNARLIEKNSEFLIGELELSKAGMKYTFTTKNFLQEPEFIQITLLNGPFKKLEGFWRFTPLNETACKINFQLSFEIKGGRLVASALAPLFNKMASSQVEAFIKRAGEVYAKND